MTPEVLIKNVVNLLPYDVRVLRKDQDWHVFPADEKVRVEFSAGKKVFYEQTNKPVAAFEPDGELSALTVAAATFQPGPCLPPATPGTLYLVEASVALAFAGKPFFLGWPDGLIRIGSEIGYRQLVVPQPFEVALTIGAGRQAQPEFEQPQEVVN